MPDHVNNVIVCWFDRVLTRRRIAFLEFNLDCAFILGPITVCIIIRHLNSSGKFGAQARALLITFGPGSINPHHLHPRGTELLYLIEGDLTVGVIDSNNTLFEVNITTGNSLRSSTINNHNPED
jgi:hypothetical protein